MKKQDKLYLILIIGTLFAFSLVIKSPDCYFPKEEIKTEEPTYESIDVVNEMLETSYVAMPTVGLSMYPEILPESLCSCEKADDYVYDDIIAFHVVYEGQLYFVMHKIADIIPNGKFITRGTNNAKIDPWIIPEEDVFCKVKEISLFEKMINNMKGGLI